MSFVAKIPVSCLAALGIILGVSQLTTGHIRIREPPNRSSIWRDERFAQFNPAVNNNDDGVYCGRILQLPAVDNCGVCGDPLSDPEPRPNSHGGIYGRGIITGKYERGQVIPLSLEMTIPHKGSLHVRLCEGVPETDECFLRNPKLEITTTEGTFTELPITDDKPHWINGTLRLPANIACTNCVIRLNYRGGSNFGECEDGSQDYGCGLQQNFRSCSDISIG